MTTTYQRIEYDLRRKEKDPEFIFDVLFGDNMTIEECITLDCLHPCYLVDVPGSDERNPCGHCLYSYGKDERIHPMCD